MTSSSNSSNFGNSAKYNLKHLIQTGNETSLFNILLRLTGNQKTQKLDEIDNIIAQLCNEKGTSPERYQGILDMTEHFRQNLSPGENPDDMDACEFQLWYEAQRDYYQKHHLGLLQRYRESSDFEAYEKELKKTPEDYIAEVFGEQTNEFFIQCQ